MPPDFDVIGAVIMHSAIIYLNAGQSDVEVVKAQFTLVYHT
jgi:hypothetical protein